MKFARTSTSSCSSTYHVYSIPGFEPVNILVYAIVGGTMALDFIDYGFCKRFHYSEKYDSKKNLEKGSTCFSHQDPNFPVGPEIGIDFDKETVEKWVLETIPKKLLRESRIARIVEITGNENPSSRRFHNKEGRSYFHIRVDLHSHLVGKVFTSIAGASIDSTYCIGRVTDKDMEWKYINDFWRGIINSMNALLDRTYRASEKFNFEDFTEEEFDAYLSLLKTITESGK